MRQARGPRALPEALVAGLAVRVFVALFGLLAPPSSGSYSHPRALFEDGLWWASDGLLLAGALALVGRTSGRAARGARLIAGGAGAGLALAIVWALWVTTSPSVYEVRRYASFATAAVTSIGFALAAWDRPRRAAALVAGALACHLPPFLAAVVFARWPRGDGAMLLHAALGLGRAACLAALAWSIPVGPAVPDPAAAARGLRQAALSLWFRVIMAVVGTLLTLWLLAVGARGGASVLAFAAFAGSLVGVLSSAMFARGCLGLAAAGVRDAGRWAPVLAGAAAVWCFGVQLGQLRAWNLASPHLDGFAAEEAAAVAASVPLVALASSVLLGSSVVRFAGARGLGELRVDATARLAAYVVMTLSSVAIQRWGLGRARSMGAFASLGLIAAVAGLWAVAALARVCRLGADALVAEPGLPTATVVREPR